MFASEIRSKRVEQMPSGRHWRWHLDAVFAKANGVNNYLWWAIEHEGQVLEAIVAKKRDRKAALKFFRKSMRRPGQPEVVVSNVLRSLGTVLTTLATPDNRETGRWLSNRAESER